MDADALFARAADCLRANRIAEARVLFGNALPDGTRDPDSAHAGLPVTRGEKLIASRWIKARPFEMPVGGQAG